MDFSTNHSRYSSNSIVEGSDEEASLNVVAISITLVIIMVFTIFGNALVLLSFYAQPSLRKVKYFPIINLALADLLCAVTAMPLYIVKKNISLNININERLVCDLYRFLYFFTEYASIMSLMAISIERVLVIYKPLKYRNFISSRIMITALIICWIEALLVSTMPFYWRRNHDGNCTNSPTANWSLMAITINVFTPFLIMLSCHCYIYLKTLKEFDGSNQTLTQNYVATEIIQAENWKMERKATISFSVVIGVFVFCWGPSTLYYFLRNLCPECFTRSFSYFKSVFSATMKILTFCNSFMNPVVYFWLNIEFRNAFTRVLRREWTTRSRSGTANSLNAFLGNITQHLPERRRSDFRLTKLPTGDICKL